MKTYEIDMKSGELFPKILKFMIPLVLTGFVQQLFSTVDMMVLGKLLGSTALAAIGATTFLTKLQVNLFLGLSTGVNVVIAQWIGNGSDNDVKEAVHTAVLLAVICGFIMIGICYTIARPMLIMMGTPEDVLDMAVLYMKLYFLGMPFILVYNIGAGILRSIGDTRHGFYFLIVSGICNVILDLLLVAVFGLGVGGVAAATALSQAAAAALTLNCLAKEESSCRLEWKQLKIHREKLTSILKVGFLVGIQSVLFNLVNLVLQSSVNSFGKTIMAGNSAANSLESFLYCFVNAAGLAAVSFVSQNRGAGERKRMFAALRQCMVISAIICLVLGNLMHFLGIPLLKLYVSETEVLEAGLLRLRICGSLYFLNAIQHVWASGFRGLGYNFLPTILAFLGLCATRFVWLTFIFPQYHTYTMMLAVFPISWIVVTSMDLAAYLVIRRMTVL